MLGDSFLILNFGLDIIDSVRGLNLKGDGLSGQGFNENLHTTSQSQNQMQGRLFLNVVIRQSSAVFELLTSENQSLLIRRDTLFILNFRFHIIDSVRGLNLKGDGLSGQGFNENLHTTSQSQNQMQGRLLLNVIVGESSTIF
ncbi:hypothetical protein OGATHE_005193 [Ogataea polymorpha]|uniref:Uncharacterized protein n=1 Tax=Ogataea polymorpha TaxID=460523 RepID=A0A9P8T0Q9_9ASCO|nr:hypothetical protein OGATHE_005193 [Ogataea polymorpha]